MAFWHQRSRDRAGQIQIIGRWLAQLMVVIGLGLLCLTGWSLPVQAQVDRTDLPSETVQDIAELRQKAFGLLFPFGIAIIRSIHTAIGRNTA